ncbi:hypothetical protein D3C74_397410 [compost metagenome]
MPGDVLQCLRLIMHHNLKPCLRLLNAGVQQLSPTLKLAGVLNVQIWSSLASALRTEWMWIRQTIKAVTSSFTRQDLLHRLIQLLCFSLGFVNGILYSLGIFSRIDPLILVVNAVTMPTRQTPQVDQLIRIRSSQIPPASKHHIGRNLNLGCSFVHSLLDRRLDLNIT